MQNGNRRITNGKGVSRQTAALYPHEARHCGAGSAVLLCCGKRGGYMLNIIRAQALDESATPEEIFQTLPDDIRGHCVRVARYSGILADQMTILGVCRGDPLLTPEGCALLSKAVRYHDIGKALMPCEVLYKPEALNRREWHIIHMHPTLAVDILQNALERQPNEQERLYWELAQEIAACHHERWDGSGYPRGLKGNETPLAARICGIVDVYDAMTSARPYRKKLTHEHACCEILLREDGLYDPDVLRVFRSCVESGRIHCGLTPVPSFDGS